MLDFQTDAHPYQVSGSRHLWNSTATGGAAVLWLDPGYGKTMIVLHTFKALYDAGMVKSMLIIAPLRVVQTVWAQEIENWASLKGLVAARLHGPKKEKWLKRRDVNIWLVNYEGIPWLSGLAKKGMLTIQFDVIVFDEVRRMKNATGKRFKSIRPLAAMATYRWGLTGTPASNGLMDLFGQFMILDGGAALGNRITRFRQEFFEKHYDGFTWLPRPGAQEAIEARIEPYIFRADGFLDLPEFVHDPRVIPLDAKARKEYTTLKQNLVTQLGEGTVLTAANAAVLVGKLKQMANGRVYDEDRKVIQIHSAKADALRELVEELGSEQLLIAYEFNHDLTQIREILGDDIPYLGAGVNETTALSNVDRWNSGEIQIMAAHPASAGHGLNLQKGNAHHILWWGPTFDLDHYIQFNDRLRRQGNKAESVVIHTFVTERSVDEIAVSAREEKATLQDALLTALTVEFGDSITLDTTNQENEPMADLQFKSDAAQAAQPADAAPANPFGAQAAQPADAAPANPFTSQGTPPAPTQQVQSIQQEVAAPAPQQPVQTEQANPFANAGQAGPVVDTSNVPDAEVVNTPTAAPAAASDTGWQEPAPETSANMVSQTSTSGFLALNMMIPADRYADAVAAVGRILKKKG